MVSFAPPQGCGQAKHQKCEPAATGHRPASMPGQQAPEKIGPNPQVTRNRPKIDTISATTPMLQPYRSKSFTTPTEWTCIPPPYAQGLCHGPVQEAARKHHSWDTKNLVFEGKVPNVLLPQGIP